jgi:hypothetical protein
MAKIIEIGTISFKGREIPLTYAELEQAAKEQVQIYKDHKNNYHKFNETWFSTSKETPMKGGIFTIIDKHIPVSFIDKYKKLHLGFIVDFKYEKSTEQVMATVVIRDSHGIMEDGCYNCMVRLKSLISDEKIIAPKFSI